MESIILPGIESFGDELPLLEQLPRVIFEQPLTRFLPREGSPPKKKPVTGSLSKPKVFRSHPLSKTKVFRSPAFSKDFQPLFNFTASIIDGKSYYLCKYPGCDYYNTDELTMSKHYYTHRTKYSYQCPKCGKSYGSAHSTRNHCDRYHGYKVYFDNPRVYLKNDVIVKIGTPDFPGLPDELLSNEELQSLC
jgi:hypothetical protein